MIKVLHSADWHLDAPMRSLRPEQAAYLRAHLLRLPRQAAMVCREQGCDMMVLSGDIFDGPATAESITALRDALEAAAVPVFIAPGNHDPYTPSSPWQRERWSANVHIFKENEPRSVVLRGLSCRVWGGAFTQSRSGPMLEGFRAEGSEQHAIGVFHADPLTPGSPYCPVSQAQVRESGLDYLALGHIHQQGSFTAGGTLAAWPGCAMGRGFDELGPKGCLIATLDEGVHTEFIPFEAPGFYEFSVEPGADPAAAALGVLPPGGSKSFFRLRFTGEAEPVDLPKVYAALTAYPNLTLSDRTVPPMDAWATADEDTLEGAFFRILKESADGQDEQTCRALELAAKLSRRILLGQEVTLP